MFDKPNFVKKILVLFIVFVVPSVGYFLLKTGENIYKPLRVLGPKEVASTFHKVKGKEIPDTIYHQVKMYPQEVKNHVFLANFLLDSNLAANKESNEQMARLVHYFSKNPEVRFVTFSANPNYLTDSLKTDNWLVENNDQLILANAAKQQYLLNEIQIDSVANTVVPSRRFVLVDNQQRIRGIYLIKNRFNVDSLIEDVKVATVEMLRSQNKMK
ncbi:hypothetical protein [Solitalea koreensis]|uniref:Protein SCO1/2 n=1 Tax=Solitalea koreensis TaxID=543615 RepID=A0A521AVN6_9SPHI|nr:hypothetical protein [Solitalea koreensis]SMO38865.1 protein SCO1/2 [Solitalea koreensis]